MSQVYNFFKYFYSVVEIIFHNRQTDTHLFFCTCRKKLSNPSDGISTVTHHTLRTGILKAGSTQDLPTSSKSLYNHYQSNWSSHAASSLRSFCFPWRVWNRGQLVCACVSRGMKRGCYLKCLRTLVVLYQRTQTLKGRCWRIIYLLSAFIWLIILYTKNNIRFERDLWNTCTRTHRPVGNHLATT